MYRTNFICLNGCENEFLTLRELCRLRVLGNVIFRKVCGHKEGKLEEARANCIMSSHYLYSPPNIRVIR